MSRQPHQPSNCLRNALRRQRHGALVNLCRVFRIPAETHGTEDDDRWGQAAIGELLRGNVVRKGCLHDPAATEAAFAGGWLHTGDLGVRHPDGSVEIRNWAKDIISGGENISTIEAESVLYRYPAVLEAAVVARPDATWGETPCAFVTLKPGQRRTRWG